jgi:hypothetical protein
MKRASTVSILILMLAVGAGSALAQESGKRVLILGVGGSQAVATDPNDPTSIAEYTQNFSQVITLTHRNDRAADPGFAYWAKDLAWATYEDVRGSLASHSRDVLRPLRLSPSDTVMAHSWAAMALMYGIRDGQVAAPGRLVIINPPLITPEGSREWRAFAERHPQLALDVYIGTDDLLHRLRVNEAAGRYERYSPGDALLPFLTPEAPARVRVRMYPGDHRLLGFMEFVARTGQYGVRPRVVGGNVVIAGPPVPEFLKKDLYPGAATGYGYLFETGPGMARAQALARSAGVGREPQTRELLRVQLQERAERSARELARARWQFVALLISTACKAPYVLREFESRGLVPGVSIPLSDIRTGYEGERSSMSRCERELLEEIIRNPRNLSILALADRGERYRREHDPIRIAGKEIDRLFTSIARAFSEQIEAFIDSITSPGSSSASEGGGRGGGGGGGRDRGSSGINFSSPTYDQLNSGSFRWN